MQTNKCPPPPPRHIEIIHAHLKMNLLEVLKEINSAENVWLRASFPSAAPLKLVPFLT